MLLKAVRRYGILAKRSTSITSVQQLSLPKFDTAMRRQYHSYPDPDEKPIISTHKSDSKKVIKSDKEVGVSAGLSLNNNEIIEHMDNLTTGLKPPPMELKKTILPNGITVASHDKHGMMTSVSFNIGTGRLVIKCRISVGLHATVLAILAWYF